MTCPIQRVAGQMSSAMLTASAHRIMPAMIILQKQRAQTTIVRSLALKTAAGPRQIIWIWEKVSVILRAIMAQHIAQDATQPMRYSGTQAALRISATSWEAAMQLKMNQDASPAMTANPSQQNSSVQEAPISR